jgi:FtsP/CotA-like multicopper oxidase with cupredoxin domain
MDATMLRNSDGTSLFYDTNTIYLGVGQSYDVVVQAPNTPGTYLLYNRDYHRLSNAGAPGYGGQMTELRIQPAGTLDTQTEPNTNPRI